MTETICNITNIEQEPSFSNFEVQIVHYFFNQYLYLLSDTSKHKTHFISYITQFTVCFASTILIYKRRVPVNGHCVS